MLKETRLIGRKRRTISPEYPIRRSLILLEPRGKMNTVISYDAVWTLLANSPSINPRANFFNIHELRKHFAKALKKIPCPQLAVNGWAGAVMSPKMYALIDQNVFHLNIAPTTSTPAYPNKFNPDGANVPYSQEEKSTINAKLELTKNYFKTLEEHLPCMLRHTR